MKVFSSDCKYLCMAARMQIGTVCALFTQSAKELASAKQDTHLIPQVVVQVRVTDLLQRLNVVHRDQVRVQVHELDGHLLEGALRQQVPLDAAQRLVGVVVRLHTSTKRNELFRSAERRAQVQPLRSTSHSAHRRLADEIHQLLVGSVWACSSALLSRVKCLQCRGTCVQHTRLQTGVPPARRGPAPPAAAD